MLLNNKCELQKQDKCPDMILYSSTMSAVKNYKLDIKSLPIKTMSGGFRTLLPMIQFYLN